MNKGLWILVGCAGAFVTFGVYNAANNISIAFGGGGVAADGVTPQIGLKITNPSPTFGVPVPPISGFVYDSNNNVLGTVTSPGWQWVPANGVATIYMNVNLSSGISVVSSIISSITSGNYSSLPTGVKFVANAVFGPFSIPLIDQTENLTQLL